jgi:SAM-dependent methyltransferase
MSEYSTNVPICDYEGSAWKTAFWHGREYEDRAERIALAHLLPRRGTRLVEIGAGFGRLADFYRGYERVVLFDYARSMLADARVRLGDDPRFIFVAGDLYHLPFAPNAFDTTVTVRVLHHVADIPRAFAEIARVVRPQGTYVLEFANKRHLKAIARFLLRRGVNPFTHEPYEFVKLNFDFHPSYIRQNLQRVEFVPGATRGVSILRAGILKRAIPAPLLAALDGALQVPTAPLALAPSMFIRAVSEKKDAPVLNPALWRCLKCDSVELDDTREGLYCRACGTLWPLVEGIYDCRL